LLQYLVLHLAQELLAASPQALQFEPSEATAVEIAIKVDNEQGNTQVNNNKNE
jgi:hypothetical protein